MENSTDDRGNESLGGFPDPEEFEIVKKLAGKYWLNLLNNFFLPFQIFSKNLAEAEESWRGYRVQYFSPHQVVNFAKTDNLLKISNLVPPMAFRYSVISRAFWVVDLVFVDLSKSLLLFVPYSRSLLRFLFLHSHKMKIREVTKPRERLLRRVLLCFYDETRKNNKFEIREGRNKRKIAMELKIT